MSDGAECGQVHRQHLEESSRCASLQRQLAEEKAVGVRSQQQLYHACAEVALLKVRSGHRPSAQIPWLSG